MSKQTPFEELDQRWSDLPLPDADASWKDMNALLDEEDRKRIPPILPTFLSGCAGWGLLLLVLSVGAIGLYWNYQKDPVAPGARGSVPSVAGPSQPPGAEPATGSDRPGESSPTQSTTTPPTSGVPTAAPTETGTPTLNANPAGTISPANPTAVATKKDLQSHQKTAPVHPVTGADKPVKSTRRPTVVAKIRNKTAITSPAIPVAKAGSPKGSKSPANAGTDVPGNEGRDAATPVEKVPGTSAATVVVTPPGGRKEKEPGVVTAPAAPDSVAKTTAVTPLPAGDSATIAKSAEAAKKKANRAPWFSAGVGISQAIPVAGQQGSTGNYQGKANPFTEHVPSAWIRAHKGRWFLQGEVRFNAPQLLPGFAFTQKTIFDTAAHAVQTDRQQLRKAWYHQFPLTVNYQVLPRWSIGTGMQWSVLYRAAGERRTLRRDLSSSQPKESIVGFQVPGYRDSFLYKSQWQFVVQTEWNWRRWGLGLRYRSDLEPFMRYTRPDGEVLDVRNEAFEATLRFRLWQSKRRK
ncbi:MAG: hypothetical protein EOO15_07760 [Chitinophagaceae bacterium]|nr:MAG: hypothetical protein EOO15_07760 [Chitinophagaceae bacterium]